MKSRSLEGGKNRRDSGHLGARTTVIEGEVAGSTGIGVGKWIEFVTIPGSRFVECPRCGKKVAGIGIAKGAHASHCLKAGK